MSNDLLNEKDEVVFKQVSGIMEEFRTGVINNSFSGAKWYTEKLDVLTGSYGYLCERFSRIRTTRNNNEVKKFVSIKHEVESNGGKFTATSAEREAREFVSDLALAEHILEGYKESALQGMNTCKKQIEVLLEERKMEAR